MMVMMMMMYSFLLLETTFPAAFAPRMAMFMLASLASALDSYPQFTYTHEFRLRMPGIPVRVSSHTLHVVLVVWRDLVELLVVL